MHGAVILTREFMGSDEIVFSSGAVDCIGVEQVIWRALLCHSGQERAACNWLRMRQLQPYWPRYRCEPTRIQAPRNVRWRSVLSGYIFLPVPMMRAIDTDYFEFCPGVWGMMREGKQVAVLTEMDIANIRRLEEALQSSAIAAEQGIPLKVGQKVRIVAFEIDGVVVEIINKHKILVEAQWFRSKRVMTIDSAGLKAV